MYVCIYVCVCSVQQPVTPLPSSSSSAVSNQKQQAYEQEEDGDDAANEETFISVESQVGQVVMAKTYMCRSCNINHITNSPPKR